MNQVEKFKEVTEKMVAMYEKKNHDYGDSFTKSMNKWGMIAAAVRMSDKMNRIESLIQNENLVKEESVMDTLFDMACYSVMTYAYLSNKKENFKCKCNRTDEE